ncbi:MAG TPA: TetR/AcrR family transcriptional regulator [Allosphingosinicella sp.]|nr:TetR/AcrR family transcriptional regulator [Allosphingosinicella sp.]
MESQALPPPRRGRPRSETARRAILRAARELLDEGGLLSVTMEGVAARAGVGKPTVYRHWSNRYEVAMAALIEATSGTEAPRRRDAPLEALGEQLHRLAELFTSSTGRNVAAVLVSGYGETELSKAFRLYFVQARRDEGRALLRQAIAAGRIRAGVDLELVLDLIYGPIFYRLTMAHAPIDAGFVDALLREVLSGIAVHRPGRAGGLPFR